MPRSDTEVNTLSRVISASVSAIITSLYATPLDNTKIRMQVQGTGNCDISSCVYCYPEHIRISQYLDKQKQKQNHANSNLNLHINVNKIKSIKINVPQNNTLLNDSFYFFDNGLMEHQLPAVKLQSTLSHSKCTKMPFNNSLDAFIKILRYEGVSHLYSGLGVTLWMAAPAIVLYYSTYDTLRNYLLNNVSYINEYQIQNFVPGICGCTARMFACSVISPLELIRTQIMAKTINRELTVIQAIKLNLNSGGFFSLWKGLVPSLWRDVPFSGVFWSSYELWKDFFRKRYETKIMKNVEKFSLNDNPNVDETFGVAFSSGALSGFTAALLTQPCDVIKTRRQAALLGIDTGIESKTLIAIGREVIRKQGFTGLYAGMPARLTRVTISCAVMVSGYEVGKHALTLLRHKYF